MCFLLPSAYCCLKRRARSFPDKPTSPGVIDTRKSRNLAAFTCVCCAPYPVDPATFLPATVNSATGSRETDTRNHHPTGRHHPPTRTFSRGHFLPPVPRYPSGLPLFPVEDNPRQSRVSRKCVHLESGPRVSSSLPMCGTFSPISFRLSACVSRVRAILQISVSGTEEA